MDEDHGFDLIPTKRKKPTTNFEQCLICQSIKKNASLGKGQLPSIEKLINAAKVRRDECFERIYVDFENLTSRDVLWHNSCYASYTSERNLGSLSTASGAEVDSRSERNRTSFDWTKCIFCRKGSRKKDVKLISIATFEGCKSIKAAAEARCDEELLLVLRSVDLIASEGKYHKSCHASYVSKTNIKSQCLDDKPVNEYEEAFVEFLGIIRPEILRGKAYDMNYLLQLYKDMLIKRDVNADSYTRQNLKLRLKSIFRDSLVFHQPHGSTKPEIVYSSSLSLLDVINAATRTQIRTATDTAQNELVRNEPNKEMKTIYEAAAIIRSDISKCKGIKIDPLSVEDLNMEKARALIPDHLYWLLRYMVTSEVYDTDSSHRCSNVTHERKIVMIGQDVIHAVSNARVKLPKHVGLGITIKHLTRSKQLITLLNRMGHCCSYEQTEIVETALANEAIARSELNGGVIIPSNISPGMFVHMAADNNDFKEETIDGKNTTHATTIVAFQRKQYGPMPAREVYGDHTEKRRSLDSSRPIVTVEDISVRGRHPSVTNYLSNIKNAHWLQSNDQFLSACLDDLVWLLLRICSDTLFEVNYPQLIDDQKIPGWSGFQSLKFSDTSPSTVIGYCPMIQADANEYSTIHRVMKLSLEMANALGQSDSVVTFDLAIYIKAKQLQIRYPQEFKNVVVRLGGFHIALNYLSLLGKMYSNSGLEDLLIDSGVYAPGTTNALMAGKSYNRGVRAHKLCLEALFRLVWKAFIIWLEEKTPGLEEAAKRKILESLKKCQQSNDKKGYLKENWQPLRDGLDTLLLLFRDFEKERKGKSKLFAFWSEYMSMVSLLLQFIKAERTGNWNLHLSSTVEMLPYFYAMDRVNYARWLPVYLADMHALHDQHPEVHSEFTAGNHSVSRSQRPFGQVWSDMALEQSINCDSKSKGGLVGMTQKEDAVDRWFLTSHERAAITRSIKEMCDVENDMIGTHKEASVKRIEKDEKDIQSLVSRFTSGLMNDPFATTEENSADTALSNIATGVVLPDKVADRLVNAPDIGRNSMHNFINSRLDTNEVSFWDPLTKLKIETFSTTKRKISMKGPREKIVTVNADRELFGRLLVVAKAREINLKDILSYELCSVPVSLAHPDGTMRKTAKSALMPILENNIDSKPRLPVSEMPTAVIIDAMALIQMVKSAGAATFGEMADKYFDIINRVLSQNNCSRVDLVFDQYRPLSIKSVERQQRGETLSMEIKIHNQNTPIPRQWGKFLSNPKNKQNLAQFLCESLSVLSELQLQPHQTVVLAGGFQDGKETVLCSSGYSSSVPSLFSDQEEADTRLILHAKHASNSHQRIVVQSPDTDVAVLCVAHFQNVVCQELWFQTGVRDKARFIPIHSIQSSLGPQLSKALPAYHALTGCDTTSALSGIGKKRAWKVFVNDAQAQQQLARLGEEPLIQEPQLKSCEAFICSLYTTARRFDKADVARYFLFCQKNQRSESLPPTSESLSHHIKRANFQTHIWNRALHPMQNLPSPEGFGWKLEDDQLLPVLMTKSPAPEGIAELTTCSCKKSQCLRNCSCKSNDLPCTEACTCMADESCLNDAVDSIDSESETESESESENESDSLDI